MAIARYYDASKNPDGGELPGVPLRDLTEEEFAELPSWLQANVGAVPFYRKTKPRHPSEAEAEAPTEQVGAADGVEKTAILTDADGTVAELTTTTTTSPAGATTRRRRE